MFKGRQCRKRQFHDYKGIKQAFRLAGIPLMLANPVTCERVIAAHPSWDEKEKNRMRAIWVAPAK